jgi:hypothetical protein
MSNHRDPVIPPGLSDLHTDGNYQPRHRAVPCLHCGLGQHRHFLDHCPTGSMARFAPDEESPKPVVHLLKPRGGIECGTRGNWSVEINDVTCVDCIERHEMLTAEPEGDGLRTFQVEVQFEVTIDERGAASYLPIAAPLENKVRKMVDDLLETYVTPMLLNTNYDALTIHWEILPDSVSEYDGESFVRVKPS